MFYLVYCYCYSIIKLLFVSKTVALELSSKDLVNNRVVSVPEELYKKGCVDDVSEGLRVS